METGSVRWCSACGAYSATRGRLLAKPCPGKISSTSAGGRAQQLRFLKEGSHPKIGVRIGGTATRTTAADDASVGGALANQGHVDAGDGRDDVATLAQTAEGRRRFRVRARLAGVAPPLVALGATQQRLHDNECSIGGEVDGNGANVDGAVSDSVSVKRRRTAVQSLIEAAKAPALEAAQVANGDEASRSRADIINSTTQAGTAVDTATYGNTAGVNGDDGTGAIRDGTRGHVRAEGQPAMGIDTSGDVDGVPVRYAHKRSVMDIGATSVAAPSAGARGVPRAHPALCRSSALPLPKRSRFGKASCSQSEAIDYGAEPVSNALRKRPAGRSDSDEDCYGRKRPRIMPGHADWRPLCLARQRHKPAAVKIDRITAQARNTSFVEVWAPD